MKSVSYSQRCQYKGTHMDIETALGLNSLKINRVIKPKDIINRMFNNAYTG